MIAAWFLNIFMLQNPICPIKGVVKHNFRKLKKNQITRLLLQLGLLNFYIVSIALLSRIRY